MAPTDKAANNVVVSRKRYYDNTLNKNLALQKHMSITGLMSLLTSCHAAIKNHVIKYCKTVYERKGKTLFWFIKNSGEILNGLKSRGLLASSSSTYDFSTLYTTLPHNLIKTNRIEQTFNRGGSVYLALMILKKHFYF